MNNSPLIRFHGYSNSWKNLKLKEHSKLITKGTTPKSKTIKGDINYIKVENLRSGKIFVSSKISENDHFSFLKRSILHEGDILFSIAGTLGRAAIVRKSILPANTNQALAIIRGYNFNSTFLLTALSGKVVREYVQKNPTVGAQPNLSLEQVGNLIISSPLIEEQNEIGIFFEKIDDTISLHQQELDALKQTKKGFFQKMFPQEGQYTPLLRFNGFDGSWKTKNLGDVLESIYNGQTPSRDRKDFWNGQINWLSSGELNRGIVKSTIEKITKLGQSNSNLKIVPKNTFVIAITGLEAAGTRGNCGILDIDTTLNQSCMALFPKKDLLDTTFLFQWYRKVGEKYGLRFTQGTKQQSYNAEIIKKLEICLPSLDEQIQIGKFFKELDEVIELKEQELEALKNTKQGFLQKMFV
ncbi:MULTISPECIES: restriction endonuclease subunit S [Exiguobacterium]|uniref:restriction endonuclease subunit S n=1 Tax=Exiguobacterium TaxID=33986 RepID=UPI001BE806D8|nr:MULTISPECIES: restriction endonuclease subunit S [Exiguobacterium]MCT4792163.1 restriction endonuclease subunit S [Exiguobacterium artemiae]